MALLNAMHIFFGKTQAIFVVSIRREKNMSVLDNWGKWKEFLGHRIDQAKKTGVNENVLTEVAAEIGGYLAKKVEPRNDHEQVLADLWSVADKDEQHAMASMMVKLAEKED